MMNTSTNTAFIKPFNLFIKLFLFVFLPVSVCLYTGTADADSLQDEMQSRMTELQDTGELFIDGNKIAATHLLPAFYTQRNFTLAWNNRDKSRELINIISHIDEEGLNRDDYFLDTLAEYLKRDKQLTIAEQVDFDILQTESLLRLGYHLRFGKVNPANLDANWNLERKLEDEDPVYIIQAAIDSDSIQSFIDNFIPRQPFYVRYRKALAEYRDIKNLGGWPRVPDGPTLKPGMQDPRVEILKQRLHKEGFLEGITTPADFFDYALEQAVIRFQQLHGLKDDGAVGKKTLEELNINVVDRINQIRVNLERGRWVFKDVQGDFLIVNIAGYKAYLVRDNKLAWTARVIIGKPYRETPTFKSEIKYLVLNPTWTIPPVILRNDILPVARTNPDYIRQRNFEVYDRQGNQVNPDSLDWSQFSGKNFPYILRQPPGPDNSLGRIKFDFENPHAVYIHDTPHRELFNQPDRSLSSGCIRIENPMQLAEILLNDRDKWGEQQLKAVVETNKTQIVHLPRPETIMILYWTVVIEEDGAVQFTKDIYGRDQKILQALDGEFNISLPGGLPEQYYRQ